MEQRKVNQGCQEPQLIPLSLYWAYRKASVKGHSLPPDDPDDVPILPPPFSLPTCAKITSFSF